MCSLFGDNSVFLSLFITISCGVFIVLAPGHVVGIRTVEARKVATDPVDGLLYGGNKQLGRGLRFSLTFPTLQSFDAPIAAPLNYKRRRETKFSVFPPSPAGHGRDAVTFVDLGTGQINSVGCTHNLLAG